MDLPFGNELPELDVLIVGAGLSGLTSAVKILSKESSLKVEIIEGASNPGGQLGMDNRKFVSKEQTELNAFLNDLNVELNECHADSCLLSRCWQLDRGVTATPVKFELARYIDMLELRMKNFSYARYKFRRRISTMERHICANLFFSQSRQFMFNVVQLASGVSASDINYDEFMCLCNSSGGLKMLIDLYFAMSPSLLSISTKSLQATLIKRLQYAQITNGVKAVKIRHFKNYVMLTDSTGKVRIAETLILAIPWNCVSQLQFEPQLPREFRQPSRASNGSKAMITQYSLLYNKSHWATQGYSGQFMNVHPLVVGYEIKPAELSGYMMHDVDKSDIVRETVLDLLAEQFGEGMLDPLQYKAETCQLNTATHKPLTKPWNRIIWSSSAALATSDRNLMGGAVESGIRAAVNALFMIRPQVVDRNDLRVLEDSNRRANVSSSYVTGLFSRFNLYNITFYGVFVIGLICLLSYGCSCTVQN